MAIKPPDFTLKIPDHTPFDAENAMKVVKALIVEDHPLRLTVRYNSGIQGKTESKWLEVRATNQRGSYTLCFLVHQGIVGPVIAVISPTGSAFDIDHPGAGNPAQYRTVEDTQALTRLLVPETNIITLRPLWRLEVDGKTVHRGLDLGPSPKRFTYPRELDQGPVFEDVEKAERALQKFSEYYKDALTREVVLKPKKSK